MVAKKGYIHYRVKVSKVCGIHKCGLNREKMHTVEMTIIGKMKYDLNHMTILLSVEIESKLRWKNYMSNVDWMCKTSI